MIAPVRNFFPIHSLLFVFCVFCSLTIPRPGRIEQVNQILCVTMAHLRKFRSFISSAVSPSGLFIWFCFLQSGVYLDACGWKLTPIYNHSSCHSEPLSFFPLNLWDLWVFYYFRSSVIIPEPDLHALETHLHKTTLDFRMCFCIDNK